MRVKLPRALRCAAATLVLSLLGGCVYPGSLDPSVILRYQEAMARGGPQQRDDGGALQELLPALETTGPSFHVADVDGQPVVFLTLQEAVYRGLANNLDIRVVSYTPEIGREEVMQAAAEFDYVLFGGYSITRTNGFLPLSGASDERWEHDVQIGVRQRTTTGAEWAASLDTVYGRVPGAATADGWEPTLNLSITQPLLRGGWSDRNLANLRIARLNRQTDMSAFRLQVEQTITQIVAAYWELVRARRDVMIQERLLAVSNETLDRIRRRMELDATNVQIKQTEAAVEGRRAQLLRFRKGVGDARDNLARLLADSTLNVATDIDIVPTDHPTEVEVHINATDQMITALRYNPQLEQARLAIGVADVNVTVAKNEMLPRLDLTASTDINGRSEGLGRAYADTASLDQIGWSLAAAFEYPLGNREREAAHRQRRYERLQAITDLQNQADQIAQVVRERIREIETAYDEVLIQRAAVAAAEAQLQALEDTERIRGALTPEFLQVKLAAQDTLAGSHRALIASVASYNTAMVELNQVTGTVLKMYQVELAMPVATGSAPWPELSQAPTAP